MYLSKSMLPLVAIYLKLFKYLEDIGLSFSALSYHPAEKLHAGV